MTEQEIIGGNKLIAEFNGWRHQPHIASDGTTYNLYYVKNEKDLENGTYWHLDQMRYYTDWGWLMPLVERIEAMPAKTGKDGYEFTIYGTTCEVGNFFIQELGATKIEATYKAVITFITWYNSQNS